MAFVSLEQSLTETTEMLGLTGAKIDYARHLFTSEFDHIAEEGRAEHVVGHLLDSDGSLS